MGACPSGSERVLRCTRQYEESGEASGKDRQRQSGSTGGMFVAGALWVGCPDRTPLRCAASRRHSLERRYGRRLPSTPSLGQPLGHHRGGASRGDLFLRLRVSPDRPRTSPRGNARCSPASTLRVWSALTSLIEAEQQALKTNTDSAEQRVDRVLALLRALGLTAEDAGRVLHRRPQMLGISLAAQARPVIEFLVEALGLRESHLRRVVRHAPRILELSVEEVLRPGAAFMQGTAVAASPAAATTNGTLPTSIALPFGLEGAAMAEAVAKRPHILWCARDEALRSADYVLEVLNGDRSVAMHVVSSVPQVLLASVAALRTQVQWLEQLMEAGAPAPTAAPTSGPYRTVRDDVADLIARYPSALVLSPQRSMQPRLNFLREQLGVRDLGQCVLTTPLVLEASIPHDLQPFRRLMEEELGFGARHPAIAQVATVVPEFYRRRIAALVDWLQERGGFSAPQVRQLIAAAPALLSYTGRRGSRDEALQAQLEPRLHFWTETIGLPATETLYRLPEYWCMDLHQRIIPRYAFVKTRGHRRGSGEPSWEDPQPERIFTGSDAEFCAQVAGCDLSEYLAYRDSDQWLWFYTPVI
ncbi:hypothetical protein CDCA_CDCA12G3346 [Cyanidium caldarium]|uniref:Uncharacterized protein n=1 Tax=Cyanidium caldarium TaxID=2771 RepID=A0AAV9IYX7_CYACA|nr:hypothetical protein CDCA_CDCA12G3346 [Cyanidium caldarium]